MSKHKNQLAAFDFSVVYEPGLRNPADFPSRNHRPYVEFTQKEKEELGVEDDTDNAEVLIRSLEDVV